VQATTVQAPQPKKSSQRFFWLLIDVTLTQVLPPLRDASPQNQPPRATRQVQTANSNGAKLPPSTLSVGYTDAADGCPPMTPARQRKQTASALDSQPGMPGQRGSRSGLHRDVAAAGSIPADPTEQEARVLPERRACRLWISHHVNALHRLAMHLGIPEGTPWRPQPRRAYRPETSAASVGSRCHRRVATPTTDRHARRRATETQRSQTTNRTSRDPLSPLSNYAGRPRRERRRQPTLDKLQTGHNRSPT
jgi:hypothetical protein